MKFEDIPREIQEKAADTLTQLMVNAQLIDEGLANKAALAVRSAFETLYKLESD